MGQFLPILALLVLAALFAGVSFFASTLLNPRRPTKAKTSPYECGIVEQSEAPERFPVRFFLVAMIFIVFDIEIIFLYPFTTIYRRLGLFGIIDVGVFAVAVFGSFVYLVSKGALDWGPTKQRRHSDVVVSAERTASTTIRRVGTEGRGPSVDGDGAVRHGHPGSEAA